MKKRPIGVTLLAILAGVQAVVAIIRTLQMLHLFPISLGEFRFFTFDLFGAIMWGLMALIYIWLVRSLWNLKAQGWLFLVIITTINVILNFFTILGGTPWEYILPSLVLNGAVLLYCILPGVKQAFGVVDEPLPGQR